MFGSYLPVKGFMQLSAKLIPSLHLRKFFLLMVEEAQKQVRFPEYIVN